MTAVLTDIDCELLVESHSQSFAELSDRALMHRLLACRDEAAFLEIVQRHGGMVYRVCLRILNRTQDAEDAFQVTFLTLAQDLTDIRKKASLASWLHGVARRTSLQVIEQAASRLRRERQAARSESLPVHDGYDLELQAELDQEVGNLPEPLRQPLILCCLEGQTLESAAQQLGWSVSTVRRRLERARQLLSGRLVQRGLMAGGALGAILAEQNAALAAPPAALVAATVQTGMIHLPAPMLLAATACQPFAALTSAAFPSIGLTKLKSAFAIGAFVLLLGMGGALVAEATAQAHADSANSPIVGTGEPPAKKDLSRAPSRDHNGSSPWGAFRATAISPNGKVIAAGTDQGKIALWDAATGNLIQEWKIANPVQSMVFVGGEKSLVLGTYQGGVQIWTKKATGYAFSQTVGAKDEVVYGLSLSANGEALAVSCATGWTYLYDTNFWRPLGVLFERGNLTSGVAFSKNGAMLATAGQTFSAWNLTKDSPLWKARGERNFEQIESETKKGRLWQHATNAQPGDEVYCADIAFSPDATRVAGVNGTSRIHGGGKCLFCWDAHSGNLHWKSLAEGMTCVLYIDSGKKIATGSTDGTVRLWDAMNGRLLHETKEHKKAVRMLVAMPNDAGFLSASEDGTVLAWESAKGKPLQRFFSHE